MKIIINLIVILIMLSSCDNKNIKCANILIIEKNGKIHEYKDVEFTIWQSFSGTYYYIRKKNVFEIEINSMIVKEIKIIHKKDEGIIKKK